jgi:hypothetical protein
MLRREVHDKKVLLCEAVTAMDLMEKKHLEEMAKVREERDTEKWLLQLQIHELKAVS